MRPSGNRIWTRSALLIGFAAALTVAALYWRFDPTASPWAYAGAFVVAWAVGAEGAMHTRGKRRQAYPE